MGKPDKRAFGLERAFVFPGIRSENDNRLAEVGRPRIRKFFVIFNSRGEIERSIAENPEEILQNTVVELVRLVQKENSEPFQS